MPPRPRRRPAGRRAPTEAGIEQVPPAPDERGRPRAGRADASGRPTGKELDERERRQSTQRKAPGPKRARVAPEDVVLEKPKRAVAEPPPTDPR
jgi:hypothetical protein